MKVTHARSRLLSTPADNPLVVGLDQPGTREFVTLELTPMTASRASASRSLAPR